MTERDYNPDLTEADIVDDVTEDDEAVLVYHAVRGEKKDKKRGPSGALPQAVPGAAASGGMGAMPPAGMVGGAAIGAPAAVSFGQAQLHAGGAMAAVDDPWGSTDDDYAVPGAVTGADDDRDDKKRSGGGPMALRGSGTRGRSGPQAGAGGSAMMPPGATLGGVGGPQTASVSGAALQQAGMTNAAGSQMPLNLLQSAQATKAVTPQAFAPAAGGISVGGLAAAGSSSNVIVGGPGADLDGDGIPDNEQFPDVTIDGDGRIRMTGGSTGAGGQLLIDTDGDGIPDSPADGSGSQESQRTGAPRAAGSTGGVLIGAGSAGVIGTGGSWGTGSGSAGSVGAPYTSSGSTVAAPTTSSTWGGSTSTGSSGYTGSTWSAPTTSGTGVSPSGSSSGSYSSSTSSGPSTASIPSGSSNASTSGSTTNFSQATAGYAPTSGTDFSVNRTDLRREAAEFDDISAETKPVQQLILSSPDPRLMFGVMDAPISPYKEAVVTSAETVEETGDATMRISSNLGSNVKNYESTEEANVDGAGRII